MKFSLVSMTVVAALIAVAGGNAPVARASSAEIPAGIDTAEEASAFLLFGFGFRDICRSAYGDSTCPSVFGEREMRVTDKVYRHRYALSEDLCVLSADLVTLETGEPLTGALHLGRVASIDVKYSNRFEKSVEYAFTFSGEGVNASPGQASGAFVFFHEYADKPAFDHAAHAQAELSAMNGMLLTYRERYCPGTP